MIATFKIVMDQVSIPLFLPRLKNSLDIYGIMVLEEDFPFDSVQMDKMYGICVSHTHAYYV
jgi:hypothetical protein